MKFQRILPVALSGALLLAALALLAFPLSAETPANRAIEILRQLEEKNRDLKTLHGRFVQIRFNPMFDDRTRSTGEFWYTQPSKFRADYNEPSPAQFFMLGNMMYFYTPEIKQVDRVRIDAGDEGPINYMLVGFGIETERILEVFNVRVLDDQSTETEVVIEFISKDTDRTLDFQTIVVTFDREELIPRHMFLQETEDELTIELLEVTVNPEIPSSRYDLDFPDDVTVFEP